MNSAAVMVPTFLMAFPNGRILHLGSRHHERHPTIVYEDDDQPSARSTHTHTRVRCLAQKTAGRRQRTSAATVHVPSGDLGQTRKTAAGTSPLSRLQNAQSNKFRARGHKGSLVTHLKCGRAKRKGSLSRGPGGFTCSSQRSLNEILIVCKSKVATA